MTLLFVSLPPFLHVLGSTKLGQSMAHFEVVVFAVWGFLAAQSVAEQFVLVAAVLAVAYIGRQFLVGLIESMFVIEIGIIIIAMVIAAVDPIAVAQHLLLLVQVIQEDMVFVAVLVII